MQKIPGFRISWKYDTDVVAEAKYKDSEKTLEFVRYVNVFLSLLHKIRGEYTGFLIPIICIFYRCFGVQS